MFENLDDPNEPDAAPIDSVEARGRQIRFRRRSLIAGTTAMVLVGAIATAAALQSGTQPKKVVISESPSTTTVAESGATTESISAPTTLVDTSTSVPDAVTTTVPATGPDDTTPTLTDPPPFIDVGVPPHDPFDYSMVQIAYGDRLSIVSGAQRDITYTVTNSGGWDVELRWNNLCPTAVWGSGNTPYWKAFDDVFPAPYPTRGGNFCPMPLKAMHLAPGDSKPFTQSVIAGYRNSNGKIMPAELGQTSVQPPFLAQCAQPCDYYHERSLGVTIYPPVYEDILSFTFADKELTAASGANTKVDLTYTNILDFGVKISIYGPCWQVTAGSAQVDCSGPIPTIVIDANATVKLQGTIYARKGMVASGAPLAAGRYPVKVGYYRTEEGPDDDGVFLTVS